MRASRSPTKCSIVTRANAPVLLQSDQGRTVRGEDTVVALSAATFVSPSASDAEPSAVKEYSPGRPLAHMGGRAGSWRAITEAALEGIARRATERLDRDLSGRGASRPVQDPGARARGATARSARSGDFIEMERAALRRSKRVAMCGPWRAWAGDDRAGAQAHCRCIGDIECERSVAPRPQSVRLLRGLTPKFSCEAAAPPLSTYSTCMAASSAATIVGVQPRRARAVRRSGRAAVAAHVLAAPMGGRLGRGDGGGRG